MQNADFHGIGGDGKAGRIRFVSHRRKAGMSKHHGCRQCQQLFE